MADVIARTLDNVVDPYTSAPDFARGQVEPPSAPFDPRR
jgi:hypothetical protein